MAGACAECKRPKSAAKWGPRGAVCYPCWKALGKPIRPEKVAPVVVLEEGVPEELAAMRAAKKWVHELLPDHPDVRFWVELRKRAMRDFMAAWERAEREYAEMSKVSSTPVAIGRVEERLECAVTARVVGEMEAWLERKRVEALSRGADVQRGERK